MLAGVAGAIGQSLRANAQLPRAVVHKSATCGCCEAWVEHLRKAGFEVTVQNTTELNAVKQRAGVPAHMASCHTAEIDGYFVEGHVPVKDIERLLAQRPQAKGLAVPGMPIGSPGMEAPSGEVESYEVLLIDEKGDSRVFSRQGPAAK